LSGKVEAVEMGPAKNPHAVALGQRGGQKGGPARAAKLSPQERHAIAQKAAIVQWGKQSKSQGTGVTSVIDEQ